MTAPDLVAPVAPVAPPRRRLSSSWQMLTSDTATTLAAGMAAGTVSRTLTAPLDRLKVLAQEGLVGQCHNHPNEMARMRFLVRHVYQKEGVIAFWKGNGANCIKAGPEYAIAFTARRRIADRICSDPKRPCGWENFVLGALSGFTAQSILYPLEVTKTRLAVSRPGEYAGIWDCISQSVRRRGVLDLYTGLSANLAGVVPHRSIEMGLFFTGEQALKTCWVDGAPPIVLVSGVGFVASVVSQIFTYPLNLARTKLQTQGVNHRPYMYSSLFDCLSSVVRTDGPRGLFVGLAPNMLKAAPASTIMYTVFHTIKGMLDRSAGRHE